MSLVVFKVQSRGWLTSEAQKKYSPQRAQRKSHNTHRKDARNAKIFMQQSTVSCQDGKTGTLKRVFIDPRLRRKYNGFEIIALAFLASLR
jgi:hypothetical protein